MRSLCRMLYMSGILVSLLNMMIARMRNGERIVDMHVVPQPMISSMASSIGVPSTSSSSSSKSSSSSASSSSLLSCSSSSSSNSFACDRPGRKPARPAAKSPSALATSSVPASLMTPSRGPEACAARRCTASGCPRAAACKYHERRLTSKVSTMSQPSSSPHSTMAKCSTSPSQSGAQELPRAAAAFSAINMRGESSSPMAPPATRASARWASNGS
mmetsp:Transcript_21365/g.46516  ORF Transcript_21365/g.46516 Transcript_21365/m.46516 type:complete len:216 (-) Transcript_21365:307-954(-)